MPQYNIKAPALPLPTIDYDISQQDQVQYVLRLYFNRLDTYNNATAVSINSQNVLMWLGGPGGC
jgi:hypothetical protein